MVLLTGSGVEHSGNLQLFLAAPTSTFACTSGQQRRPCRVRRASCSRLLTDLSEHALCMQGNGAVYRTLGAMTLFITFMSFNASSTQIWQRVPLAGLIASNTIIAASFGRAPPFQFFPFKYYLLLLSVRCAAILLFSCCCASVVSESLFNTSV